MSMLNQVMSMANAAMNSARAGSGDGKEDPRDKENRTAMRALLGKAAEAGDTKRVQALSKTAQSMGIDPAPFLTYAGLPTPEQQAKRQFDTLLSQGLQQLLNGGKPVQQPASTPSAPSVPSAPTTPTSATVPSIGERQPPTSSAPTPSTPTQPPRNIFTNDFLMRAALKKFSSIDVGSHYFDSPSWFEDYGKLVNSGVPISKAVSDTAIKYGFIPDGASNLEGLSKEDRAALFEKEFSSALNDPTLDKVLSRIIPKNINPQKAKAGLVLDAMAGQGRYIPEHYQKFLDRFRGLDDPEFVSDNIKTWIFQTKGKMPSDIAPGDVADARKAMQNDAVIEAARNVAAQTTARIGSQYAMEASKPISAEDRAKYGIGTRFNTYQELADSGKRFPDQNDRKIYGQLSDLRSQIVDMRDMLFGTKKDPKSGVFNGIGNSVGARTAGRAGLIKDMAEGTVRGRNYERYKDYLAVMARSLLVLNNETGGRFTDADVRQMVQGMADVGQGLFGLPDSQDQAWQKFQDIITRLGRKLNELEKTTVIEPQGQPGAAPTSAAPAAPQYEIGKIYPGTRGRRAKYIGGEKPWQILP